MRLTLLLGLCSLLGSCGKPQVQDQTRLQGNIASDSDEIAATNNAEAHESATQVDCAQLTYDACDASSECVWDRSPGNGLCRAPIDACEVYTPGERGMPEPVMDRGDPCERANPGCAYSVRQRRCVPFVEVTECPASVDAASSVEYFCHHSGQRELECDYPGFFCECYRAPYCGGAAPPPYIEYAPRAFTCFPDVDADGCPRETPQPGSQCTVNPAATCDYGCVTYYQCSNGRWREGQYPPRP